jgi:hypothetical protein
MPPSAVMRLSQDDRTLMAAYIWAKRKIEAIEVQEAERAARRRKWTR